MKTNKTNIKLAAVALRSLLNDTTPETAVVITVENNGKYGDSIDIRPAATNLSGTFYHAEEIVDVCRTYRLSEWIGARVDDNGNAYTIVHIY